MSGYFPPSAFRSKIVVPFKYTSRRPSSTGVIEMATLPWNSEKNSVAIQAACGRYPQAMQYLISKLTFADAIIYAYPLNELERFLIFSVSVGSILYFLQCFGHR